ncbi:universal stress protein [Methanocella conradii]|uniref:universal stress protein n=1 Tax=Methanocella conradii TaxID=1175444 RepID=UPI00157D0F7D|nr:universal stress protein [Methanocella conradii]
MDKLFKKILVATDGSSCSRKAVHYAVSLAKLAGAELMAVYVVDVKTGCGLEQCITLTTPKKEALMRLYERGESAVKYVEDAATKEGVSVDKRVVEGHPAGEIIRLAQEESADLIVMGTLGLTGIKKYLLGSTADKVMRHSQVPVLTVRK